MTRITVFATLQQISKSELASASGTHTEEVMAALWAQGFMWLHTHTSSRGISLPWEILGWTLTEASRLPTADMSFGLRCFPKAWGQRVDDNIWLDYTVGVKFTPIINILVC